MLDKIKARLVVGNRQQVFKDINTISITIKLIILVKFLADLLNLETFNNSNLFTPNLKPNLITSLIITKAKIGIPRMKIYKLWDHHLLRMILEKSLTRKREQITHLKTQVIIFHKLTKIESFHQ